MATHVEKRGNRYFVVDNMTGKVVSGGYMLRDHMKPHIVRIAGKYWCGKRGVNGWWYNGLTPMGAWLNWKQKESRL